MPSEKNLIIPITDDTIQSPTHNFDVEKTASKNNSSSGRRRHGRMMYYGIGALITAVVAAIILALAFTVFKVREPTMRINSVNFAELDLTKNLTVVTDVSVKNPNALRFTFNSSLTSLLYRNNEVGVAYGPPGTVGPHRTLRTNVTVDVITARLLADSEFMGEVQNGTLGLETCTAVGGKVKILGMFKRHVDVMMNCTVSVSIASQEIVDQRCTQRMWL